jgi:hypothetical protein
MSNIQILVLLLIIIIISISGILYISKKFLSSIDDAISDISDDSTTIPSVTSLPRNAARPITTRISTTQISTTNSRTASPLPANTLEVWSEINYLGTKKFTYNLINLSSAPYKIDITGVKSIRFPTIGYNIYLMTERQHNTALSLTGGLYSNYINNSILLLPDSRTLDESLHNQKIYLVIKKI